MLLEFHCKDRYQQVPKILGDNREREVEKGCYKGAWTTNCVYTVRVDCTPLAVARRVHIQIRHSDVLTVGNEGICGDKRY
jgi:hypothetical protein